MATIIGLSGAHRNAATALSADGRIAAVCELERISRIRSAGLRPGQLPQQAIETVLRVGRKSWNDIKGYGIAEEEITLPTELSITRSDHHFAHAATAFWSSPFDDAVVVVCDRHAGGSQSVWQADERGLRECNRWRLPGFAHAYSDAAEAFGFEGWGREARLEVLARLGGGTCTSAAESLVSWSDEGLTISPEYKSRIAAWAGSNGHLAPLVRRVEIADGIQRHLGNLLLEDLKSIKSQVGGTNLCITGGLFFNSYFTTLVAESGIYERTFVPVNPGNAGVAVGAALATNGPGRNGAPISPFMGPEYDATEIKAVLDNCKLSYDYLDDEGLTRQVVRALTRGQLVGWFQGRMEWGVRALGNRSILASPTSPYTLENLNVFLKKREPHHSYSVSVCEEDAGTYFSGPPASAFMEFEYAVRSPEGFRTLMPLKTTRLRVQTVGAEPAPFRRLLKALGRETGIPVVVNTSFNGFHEPIVCTPRDAVRVFYGSGLDVAVLGNFVLRK